METPNLNITLNHKHDPDANAPQLSLGSVLEKWRKGPDESILGEFSQININSPALNNSLNHNF
eukprot:388403-Amorphochlora_amoeboformis.AAC.1